MMMVHDFSRKLEWSNGANIESDKERIKYALGDRCVRVEKTDDEVDKTGVDYYAHLARGAVVNIDAKRREAGASKFWRHGEPELAIETRSVVKPFKIGWTFSTSSSVDYILYSFEPCDSNNYYFLPFQLLRKVSYESAKRWRIKYGEMTQTSNGWKSTCIFVPASVVLLAIQKSMIYKAGA